MSLIREVYDPEKRLWYVEHDTGTPGQPERRYLASLPIPRDHAARDTPKFSTYLQSAGLAVIPRTEWPKYEGTWVRHRVPGLDQDGHGACEAYSWAALTMVARDKAGAPFVLLNGDFLYTLINGGVDMGSNAADAVQALQTYGICPSEFVTGRPIRPKGVSAACVEQAKRFRLDASDTFQCSSVEEAVTAVILGFSLSFAVQAGGRYNTDSDGTVAYLGRMLNHAQMCGEGLRIKGGKAEILGRNSWQPWGITVDGVTGMAWYQESHLKASDMLIAVRGTLQDPQDSEMPRPFGA